MGDEEGEEDVAERRKKRARGRGGRVAVKQATSKGKKGASKKKVTSNSSFYHRKRLREPDQMPQAQEGIMSVRHLDVNLVHVA